MIGVRARDKANSDELLFLAPLVVSDIGPRSTDALLQNRQITQSDVLKQQGKYSIDSEPVPEAIGLKVHVLSDVSLIPHKGIMYCLDTQRIAGMVQPTNFDPEPGSSWKAFTYQPPGHSERRHRRGKAVGSCRLAFSVRRNIRKTLSYSHYERLSRRMAS